jgi:outer membrane lipoprotein SlyB
VSEYSPFMSEAEQRRRRRDAEQAAALQQMGMVGSVVAPAAGTVLGTAAGGVIGGLVGNPLAGAGIGAGAGGALGGAGGQLANMLFGGQADRLRSKWDELDAKRLARAKFITENFAPFTGR